MVVGVMVAVVLILVTVLMKKCVSKPSSMISKQVYPSTIPPLSFSLFHSSDNLHHGFSYAISLAPPSLIIGAKGQGGDHGLPPSPEHFSGFGAKGGWLWEEEEQRRGEVEAAGGGGSRWKKCF